MTKTETWSPFILRKMYGSVKLRSKFNFALKIPPDLLTMTTNHLLVNVCEIPSIPINEITNENCFPRY